MSCTPLIYSVGFPFTEQLLIAVVLSYLYLSALAGLRGCNFYLGARLKPAGLLLLPVVAKVTKTLFSPSYRAAVAVNFSALTLL